MKLEKEPDVWVATTEKYLEGNLKLKQKKIGKMYSCRIPSFSDLLALACSFVFFFFPMGMPAPQHRATSECVSKRGIPDWEREGSLTVRPLLVRQQGLCPGFLLQRYQQLSLESTSKAVMFDLFLELLVIVFLGGPVWRDSPAAVCCLEPAVRLSHNNLLQTHSFPVEKKRII